MEWFAVWFKLGGESWTFDHWIRGYAGNVLAYAAYLAQLSYYQKGRQPEYLIADVTGKPLSPLMRW